jgi:hypothetical protein
MNRLLAWDLVMRGEYPPIDATDMLDVLETPGLRFIRTSTTMDDYLGLAEYPNVYPELQSARAQFEEAGRRRVHLSQFGQMILKPIELPGHAALTEFVYTDGTAAAFETAKHIFKNITEETVKKYTPGTTRFAAAAIVFGSEQFLKENFIPAELRGTTHLRPLSIFFGEVVADGITITRDLDDNNKIAVLNLWEGIARHRFDTVPPQMRFKNSTTVGGAYPEIPRALVKGLDGVTIAGADALTTVNDLYQSLLQDISVDPRTPAHVIRRILESWIGEPREDNPARLLSYIGKKYPTFEKEQKALLYGLFLKIYSLHEGFLVKDTPAWPPADYPPTPPLYSVEGYREETNLEADSRVIVELMQRAREPYPTIKAFIEALIGPLRSTSDALTVINSFLRSPITLSEFQNFYKNGEIDGISGVIYGLGTGNDPGRLFNNFTVRVADNNVLDGCLQILNNSQFGEFKGATFSEVVPHIAVHSRFLPDKRQMNYMFVPTCVKPDGSKSTRAEFEQYYAFAGGSISPNDVAWIALDYDFPLFSYTTFDNQSFCNIYLRGENYKYGTFQGYRAEHFPHPDLLIAISKGITDAHPRVKELWPEWFDDHSRSQWTLGVVQQWNRDIAAMPSTTPYEKAMKEIQHMFHSYAWQQIRDSSPVPSVNTSIARTSGISANLQNLNRKANRDPNAAFKNYETIILPKYSVEIGKSAPGYTPLTKRKTGFFAGESKNSYRRTLKKGLYQLMRGVGTPFDAPMALREIDYIAQLFLDDSVPNRVIYERMKDWSERYGALPDPTIRTISEMFRGMKEETRMERASAYRDRLQLLIADAVKRTKGGSSRLEEFRNALRRTLFPPSTRSALKGTKLYERLKALLAEYNDVLLQNPSIVTRANSATPSLRDPAGAVLSPLPVPKRRGFFSFGANTEYENKIEAAGHAILKAANAVPVTAKGKEIPAGFSVTPSGAAGEAIPLPPVELWEEQTGTAGMPHKVLVVRGTDGKITAVYDVTNPTTTPNINASQATVTKSGISSQVINRLLDKQWAGLGGGRRKTARRSRMVRKQTQRGGATSLPLAWYQQGAQFQGTTADPTGVGLAGSSAAWARSALPAQGGGRRRRSRRLSRRLSRRQQGGFVPSVMGAGFADMGMQLLPAAAYMGYNQFQHYKQQRRTRRRH